MAVMRLSDEELWDIIGWRPSSMVDREWGGSWTTPYAKDKTPLSADWIEWAKDEIQCMGAWSRFFGSDELVTYLCRLMYIRELGKEENSFLRVDINEEHLRGTIMSGLAASGVEIEHVWPQHLNNAIDMARQRGLIVTEDVDEWRPGMASGTGWRTYIRLTVAGRRLAIQRSPSMPKMHPADVSEPPSVHETEHVGSGATTSWTAYLSKIANRDTRSQSEQAQRQETETETPLDDSSTGESTAGGSDSSMFGIISVDEEDHLVLNRDALARHVTAQPSRKEKKKTAKRSTRATTIDAIKAALNEHLRAARDHAYDSQQRTGEPKLLPRPTQKQLAEQLGFSTSSVSRALKDKCDKELPILWEGLLNLKFVMGQR